MDDINYFTAGFSRFQKKYFNDHHELYSRLRLRQVPKAMVIACCDSRADPAIITDCDPGELFVVRNVANLVPPYEQDGGIHGVSTALEFGVRSLNVEHIIILGHALCGGVTALMEGHFATKKSEFIGPWMNIAARARNDVLTRFGHKPFDVQVRACEKATIVISLENLLTFPWIRERVEAGTLRLHGWYFDLVDGALWGYNPEMSRFEVLVEAPVEACAQGM